MEIEGKIWRHKQWIDAPTVEAGKRTWSHGDLPARSKTMKLSGIYILEIPHLKIAYIGQSINIQSRWSQHRHVLNRGNCEVKDLQYYWDRHKDAFEFRVLEQCSDNLLEKERQYAEEYVANGYTLCNDYFHVRPKSMLVSDEHIPIVTKLLRLITKGRINAEEFERYLDNL